MTTPINVRRHRWHTAAVLVATLTVTACAASANSLAAGGSGPGFWLGLWQGFIAPIAFLISLFNHNVGIYEVRNAGGWYDFGFLVGISAFFSGLGAGARGGPRSRTTEKTRT